VRSFSARAITRFACVFAVAAASVASAVRIEAQPSTERRLDGAVMRAVSNGGAVPLAGAWAVLHRVSAGGGAAIDSMRTRDDGSFAFRYRAAADSNALFFVSTTRGGVAYFTTPTRETAVRRDDATLTVFDTTSAPIPITIKGRHLIITAPDSTGTTRSVIEVYELENTDHRTRVAGENLAPTFDAPVPTGVTVINGGEGDVSPDAMRIHEGRLQVVAPIAPGLKQFSFIYDVPADASMTFAVDDSLPVLEVMIEDPRGTAVGGGLIEVSPTQVEGRAFKRFLAQDVPAPIIVAVTAPGRSTAGLRIMLVVVSVAAALMLGIGLVLLRGGPRALALGRKASPESLALRVAELDRAFAAIEHPSEEQRAKHYVERARLKGALSALLAKRDGLA
jgi:hypothetical protein